MSELEETKALVAKLMAAASAQGLDLGVMPEGSGVEDDAPLAVQCYLGRSVSEIAHETGMNLKQRGLFLFGERLVTVQEAEGRMEDMDAVRFLTWIDRHQFNYRKKREREDGEKEPIRCTMAKSMAEAILRSDDFRAHLPEIRAVVPVQLPAWKDGEVVLLAPGYNDDLQVFVADTGVRVEEMDLDKAREYLEEILRGFPFAEDDGRSIAVQVAAMVSVFCQLLLPRGVRGPMIYYNANMPGSGKSRLCELCVYPIYGQIEGVSYARGEEFKKQLDAWALRNMAYILLDNVTGFIKCEDLDRWLTMPTWGGRYMHTQRSFSAENRCLTLMNGNQATLSSDLGRRSLIVDLWCDVDPKERQGDLAFVMDQEWLADKENRSKILGALWALVRQWAESGAKPYGKLIGSFEGWSRIVPAVVTAGGFSCPLKAPELADAGNKSDVEFKRLIEAAVQKWYPLRDPKDGKREHPDQCTPLPVRLTEWAALARENNLFHSTVGDTDSARRVLDARRDGYKPLVNHEGEVQELKEEDKNYQAARWLDKSQEQKWQNILYKTFRGRKLKVGEVWYRFADRKARHSCFELKQLEGQAEE